MMDEKTRTELEAIAFRALVEHLQLKKFEETKPLHAEISGHSR